MLSVAVFMGVLGLTRLLVGGLEAIGLASLRPLLPAIGPSYRIDRPSTPRHGIKWASLIQSVGAEISDHAAR